MPTILTHPSVPLALAYGLGNSVVSRPLLLAGMAASVLPDLDVLAFHFGIPYSDALGHRGFTHSFFFASIVACIGAAMPGFLRTSRRRAFSFLFISAASHGLLDSFTNGGLGIAFFWPFSNERFFAPFHLIEVSPLGVSRFISLRGLEVLQSELINVWLPLLGMASVFAAIRRWREQTFD